MTDSDTNEVVLRGYCTAGYGLELEQLPKRKIEAEALGTRYFFTGKICKHGHLAARYTKGGTCSWCVRGWTADRSGQSFTGRIPKALAHAARTAAHKNGNLTYIPVKPCRYGHSLRWVASTNCVECDRCSRDKYKESKKDIRIAKLYGLTALEHEALFLRQGKACAICGSIHSHRRRMHIDHCHKSGRIRGLLCSCCNQALGLLKENAELMRRAAEYVNA